MAPRGRNRTWVDACKKIADAVNPKRRNRKNPSEPPAGDQTARPLSVSHPDASSPSDQPLLRDITRARNGGELSKSFIVKVVVEILQNEPNLEVAPDYDHWPLTKGIKLSDEYYVHFNPTAAAPDLQTEFAQLATPVLVSLARSLKRSAISQETVIQLYNTLVGLLKLVIIKPRDLDRRNRAMKAIYRAAVNAAELESDEVLVAVKRLTVARRGK
jgi:hypothetical protein